MYNSHSLYLRITLDIRYMDGIDRALSSLLDGCVIYIHALDSTASHRRIPTISITPDKTTRPSHTLVKYTALTAHTNYVSKALAQAQRPRKSSSR